MVMEPQATPRPYDGSASTNRPCRVASSVRRQLVVGAKELGGAVVRLHNAASPIKVDNTDLRVVQQFGERRPQDCGPDQGLTDLDVLSDVG